ncbi:CRISPR-associated endonuclease Cas2 [Candidatus Daviesbacteria bacterium]|nr:CRISPR-associated endonuclease Cas2 [Candidatus Daviesbacteria bacterium]
MPQPLTKYRKVTNFILLALEKTIDGTVRANDFLNHPGPFGFGWDYPVKKASLSKALQRLREGGFVELIADEELILRLTDKGKDRAIWARIKEFPQRWDGRWRLVIFDIPEKRRTARDLLRSKLKQWGFTHWQKSVWAAKVNCTKPLRDFIKQVGIEDWVMVIESDDVGR